MREMVEYWKKVRDESKTDDVNPTGCRAYETLLDTSLTLYQYRTARCRSRVSTVCLPWDTDYQGKLGIGDGGRGTKSSVQELSRKDMPHWQVCQISFHICHMLLGPKTQYTKTTAETIATMKFIYRFPTATCCNNFGIITNCHSPSTNITITIIITLSPSTPSPSPWTPSPSKLSPISIIQPSPKPPGGYSIRGIDCYTSPNTLLIETFFGFGGVMNLVDH